MTRKRIRVNGIVQGVGFRPFVFNLAQSLDLSGFVTNTSDGVLIEIQGSAQAVETFVRRLQSELPPLAEIIALQQNEIPVQKETDFRIKASIDSDRNETLISPDIAICDDCLRELRDPNDRRYHYPFINCTNCGPRFTIIRKIPYDRPNTTMKAFRMCAACQAEYDNPADRRFHAQPNACPACGPHVWLERTGQAKVQSENEPSLRQAVSALLNGEIVAVKGLGGFHLAVDATDEAAVRRLRQRKNREEKPLALMLPDLSAAKKIVRISDAEAQLLTSPQRPIVLLRKKTNIPIAAAVAPHNQRLGIMLPYTPLHYLLFDLLREQAPQRFPALVMTSANRSEEPIVIDNDDARQRLKDIADALLLHNRPILVRADDSVVARFANQTVFLRRSRGYVPRPVFFDDSGPSVLATGGELKNTICLTKGNRAFLSQHIGDLENVRAFDFFEQTIAHFQDILQTRPEAIACDLHPGYFSTRWAERQTEMPIFKVQHHHAHLASVLAEWQTDEPVIGIILDGTGYGYDGTIWGGEILIGHFTRVRRFAWLEPMPLPGSEAAIRQPWRTALAYLYETFGAELPDLPFLRGRPVRLILEMIDKKLNSPLTSSCGRLFDAVSVISGGRTEIRYEAQAAIEFTQAAKAPCTEPFEFEIAIPQIPVKPIIRSLTRAVLAGASFAQAATRFHCMLSRLLAELAHRARRQSGLQTVVLSGGVFQNEVLFSSLVKELKERGFRVLTHRQVPPNDGGLSLGQAAVVRALLKKGLAEVQYEEG